MKKLTYVLAAVLMVSSAIIPEVTTVTSAEQKVETCSLEGYADNTYWSDWQIKGMGLDEFQKAFDGKENLPEIKVAVLDTGVNFDDPTFEGRILTDEAVVVGEGATTANVVGGHGNNVTRGIIDASPDNVKILPIRCTDVNGDIYNTAITKGINAAIQKDVDVIVICSGTTYKYGEPGQFMPDDEQKALAAADRKGIITCVAAGNATYDTDYDIPACSPNVISVSVADKDMVLTKRSNYNADITSFSHNDGTSYATPNVAAAVAMLKTIDRNVNREQAMTILSTMAYDIGEKGVDFTYGNGLLYMGDFIQDGDISCIHDYIRTEMNGVTCQSNGIFQFTCKKCGTAFTRTEIARHRYLVTNEEAGCETEGVYQVKCALCGNVKTETIQEAKGHSYQETQVIDTVTGKGKKKTTTYKTILKCTDCGELACDNHEMSKEEVVKEATCQETGILCKYCENCGRREETEIPMTHRYVEDVVKQATCIEDGLVRKTCMDCGETSEDVIPATGHDFQTITQGKGKKKVTTNICKNCEITQ